MGLLDFLKAKIGAEGQKVSCNHLKPDGEAAPSIIRNKNREME